jgi:hypothetical protein
MTERLHPVRLVHQHLRRAASLLEQRQFAAAAAEVEAALAVDPASLAARTLQEKLTAAQRVRPPAPRPPAESTPAPPIPAPADRFVPSGVDAQAWLGFEHRIQERRFTALLDTLAAALRAGDAAGARLALEEARELRPDAPELEAAADQLSVLPLLIPATSERNRARMRTLGAVSLLACGVALLVGLDAVRTDGDVVPVSVPGNEPVNTPPPLSANVAVPKMADGAVPFLLPALAGDGMVGTVGVHPALAIEPQVQFTEPVLRPATLIDRTLPPIGEIPDDYVAPSAVPAVRDILPPATQSSLPSPPPLSAPGPRNVPSASASPSTATPSALAASALIGGSAGPPSGVAATAASPLAAAAVPPRVDEHGVTQALNQYARAYGRLDAGAARAVWPSVDERALARAFAGLESQNVSFDSCDIDVRGTTANASCRGQASYVGKVGAREPRTEPRQWRFELRRDGEAWKIESAEARRVSSY